MDNYDLSNRSIRTEGCANQKSIKPLGVDSSGNTSGSIIDVTELGKVAAFYLVVTDVVPNEGNTLDVKIQEIDPSGNSYDLFSFAQKTDIGNERIVFGDVAGKFIGKSIRYYSTIDSSGNFTYRIDAVGR